MIAQLRGTIAERIAGGVIIDCAGVGYEVYASAPTLAQIAGRDDEVVVRIYTHYTDNKISLYGFSSAVERDLFDLLITVKNVGPSSAIKILSAGAGPAEIAQMIADGQTGALKSIKGIGKKTADLLVAELKEKCDALLLSWGAPPATIRREASATSIGRDPMREDVAAALTQLGWKPAEADKAVDALVIEAGASLESLLRRALQSMPR